MSSDKNHQPEKSNPKHNRQTLASYRRTRLRVELLEGRRLLAGDTHGPAGVDVMYNYFTPEEIEALESVPYDSNLSTKTPPANYDTGDSLSSLTLVFDFKSSSQADTSDIFGNIISDFDVTSYGFAAGDFDLVANAVLAEINEDYFSELIGTVAGPPGQELDINLIMGDIGTAPPGYSEYYFIQVGTGVSGPHTGGGILGVAGGSVARNSSGSGPNSGIQVGDVIASIFTDIIVTLSGLTPGDALTSGNLAATTQGISGTSSHEAGHTLSLSHINKVGSVQPSGVPGPVMGTGAIDLPNGDRINDREFSLSGVDGQSGNAPRAHVQQLVDAIGLRNVQSGNLEAVAQADEIFYQSNSDQFITVTYSGGPGLDVSDLGTGDIRVTGPGSYDQIATFVSVDVNSDGTPRVATYRTPAPQNSWTSSANGNYSIALLDNEVRDVNGDPIPAGAIGSFVVDIPTDLGPDGFGYKASAATYSFQDISTTGTLVLDGEDDSYFALTPGNGFNFDFYGQSQSTFFVSSNGLIAFDQFNAEYANTDLTVEPTTPAIAVLWDDLDAAPGAGVYWKLVGSGDQQRLILQWETNYFSATGPISFQAILSEADNSIRINYRDLNGGSSNANEGLSASVGIKNTGEQGVERLLANFNQNSNGFVGTSRSLLFQIVNRPPTDIELSNGTLLENLPIGSVVGNLSALDADLGETFTYQLVAGAGDWDNANFDIVGDALVNTAVFDYEQLPNQLIRVGVTDSLGNTFEKELTINIVDSPELESIVIADSTDQRSRVDQLVVTFDGPVALDAGAFAVSQHGGANSSVVVNVTSSLDGQGRTVATLTFAGPLTRGNGALLDGNYQLLIDATKVSRNGLNLDGSQNGTSADILFGDDAADKFFALFGDIDGNRTVGLNDFTLFRSAFGKLAADSGYSQLFDFDDDGAIDLSDFAQFRSRFGTTLGF